MKRTSSTREKAAYYFFLFIIVLMGSVSFFATDVYVPALPEMATFFHCQQTEIQSSFTVFFLGLAACQLVSGALSDRFGRKKILVFGFLIFTVASLLCAMSSTLPEFLGFRLMQAVGGGVGSVVFRALIVDRFDKEESAKLFSIIFPIIGLSAAIAPLVGGYLTLFWGWRSTFFFVAGFGALILTLVLFFLEDKTREHSVAKKTTRKLQLQHYFGILRNVDFLGYTLIICACFCVFRSYTVESPFVFNKQGYTAEEIGRFYIALSVTYLAGSLLARILMHRMKVAKVLKIGISVFVTGGFCMLWGASTYGDSPYAIIIPMSVIALGNGLLFPIGSAKALTSVPANLSGSAAGLMGATQFIIGAFCISWVGEICRGRAFHLSLFMGVIILLGLLSYLFFLDRTSTEEVATVQDT